MSKAQTWQPSQPSMPDYDYAEQQKKNYLCFVVFVAGLPRKGTMSLRAPLGIHLDGACHHMVGVFNGTNSVHTTVNIT